MRRAIVTEGKTVEEIRDAIYESRIEGYNELQLLPGRLAEGFWTNTKPDRFVDELKPGDLLFGVAVTKRNGTESPVGR